MRADRVSRAVLLCLILFSSVVWAQSQSPVLTSTLETIQKKGVITVGTSGNMPPMTQRLEDGKLEGFDVDLANWVADAMQVKVEFKVLAFDQLIPALEKGEVDMVISNMTITPSRNMNVAFVGPYITSGKCLITSQQALASATKEELNDSRFKFAVIPHTTTEQFVKTQLPNAQIIEVETVAEGVETLLKSQVQAMVSEFQTCAMVASQYQNQGLISSYSPLTYEPIGIAVNGTDAHLINWTENFLVRLDRLGYLILLAQKWLGSSGSTPPKIAP